MNTDNNSQPGDFNKKYIEKKRAQDEQILRIIKKIEKEELLTLYVNKNEEPELNETGRSK